MHIKAVWIYNTDYIISKNKGKILVLSKLKFMTIIRLTSTAKSSC